MSKKLSKGDIRLGVDLVEFFYPLYKKADLRTKAEFAKDIFAFDIPVEEIVRVAPIKQYLYKRVIAGVKTSANGKQILIKRVRKNHSKLPNSTNIFF
jgi:hypothetical protein